MTFFCAYGHNVCIYGASSLLPECSRLAKYLNSEKSVFLDITALDDMGNRINELEQSINDLRAEMGVESSPSPVPTAKPTEDETKEGGSA
ncbi:hypothetical protein VIGAN_08246400 [Vigna angularis var. angularis]|uniref:Uncharacterized protein n=1 Tax=Vigna angularis var. angularis TaxID=157739 RepID=A0A0S3SS82_PHAAN|nr:hypothetical protein VIGAN_08246400 [Vigna angularis var. angularis]